MTRARERLSLIIPWWVKLATKLLLARIPLPHIWWHRLGLFRHGSMTDPSYAWTVFSAHLENYQSATEGKIPACALELGPGDSPFSGLFGRFLGTQKTYLVDRGSFLQWDPQTQQRFIAFAHEKKWETGWAGYPALETMGIVSLTDGLTSMRSLPDHCVDFLWSQAVLEHLPREEFAAFLFEMRRVLRPGGYMSHRVDLKDHLGGSLNHLRFSEKVWESRLFRSSGFYTNRLRHGEILEAFQGAGFTIVHERVQHWQQVPLSSGKMAPMFRHSNVDDLRVSGFTVVLRCAETPT